MFVASGSMIEGPFSLKGTAEMRLNFSFSQGWSLFQACVPSISCQRFLGISALFECILFYFCFSVHYIFINNCEIIFQGAFMENKIVLVGDNIPRAQFGTTVANIGDLNKDGLDGKSFFYI